MAVAFIDVLGAEKEEPAKVKPPPVGAFGGVKEDAAGDKVDLIAAAAFGIVIAADVPPSAIGAVLDFVDGADAIFVALSLFLLRSFRKVEYCSSTPFKTSFKSTNGSFSISLAIASDS